MLRDHVDLWLLPALWFFMPVLEDCMHVLHVEGCLTDLSAQQWSVLGGHVMLFHVPMQLATVP